MKKARRASEASLDRYDWSRARRGHWAGRLRAPRTVLLSPELYDRFGSDEAIVRTLEAALQFRDTVAPPPRKRRTPAA